MPSGNYSISFVRAQGMVHAIKDVFSDVRKNDSNTYVQYCDQKKFFHRSCWLAVNDLTPRISGVAAGHVRWHALVNFLIRTLRIGQFITVWINLKDEAEWIFDVAHPAGLFSRVVFPDRTLNIREWRWTCKPVHLTPSELEYVLHLAPAYCKQSAIPGCGAPDESLRNPVKSSATSDKNVR